MTTTPEAARLAEEAKRLTDTRPCRTGAILCMLECEGCSKVRQAHAAIDALAALSQPDEARDAARYRWLRTGKPRTTGPVKPGRIEIMQWENKQEANVLKGDVLDAAIDAAMSKEQP